MSTTTYIIIMAVCLLLSAYFSATETAFSSANVTRLKMLAEKGNSRAALACRLLERYDKLLSTILIGNNIVNIAMASLATALFVKSFGDAGATLSTIVVTVVVLIFGEISPKSIAKDCAESWAMTAAPFLRCLIWLLMPLNALFSLWKKLLNRVFRLESDNKMSQEELLMLVDEVQQEGSIDGSEGELLKNAIEFTEREAEDILTHRVDMEAVSKDASKEDIAKVFSETKYSRLPVYDGDIDNIIGVIHQKDFYTGNGIIDRDISHIIAPAVYVLKNEKISSILKLLQRKKAHVAVVLDEYGGTCGMITMEDILEELVGEIWDEHDEITETVQQTGENSFTAFHGQPPHREVSDRSGVPGGSRGWDQRVKGNTKRNGFAVPLIMRVIYLRIALGLPRISAYITARLQASRSAAERKGREAGSAGERGRAPAASAPE